MSVVNIESKSYISGGILGGHEAMRMSNKWLWQRERRKKEEQAMVAARVFKPRSLNALIPCCPLIMKNIYIYILKNMNLKFSNYLKS